MLTQARVVATHPDTRRIDVVNLRTGMHIGGVMLSGAALASDAGSWHVPDTSGVSPTAAGQLSTDGTRNVVALIEQMDGGGWVCLGFLPPNAGQMTFTEQNRSIDRHVSGSYTTIAPDGSIEAWHPSGSYFRIGTGPHQDLSSVAGPNWKTPPVAGAPTLTLETPKFSLVVDPAGNAVMTFTTLTTKGPVTMNGTLLVNGATTIDNTLTVQQLETGQDGLSVTGPITATGDVKAGSISLQGHVHGGVQSGSSNTGLPSG